MNHGTLVAEECKRGLLNIMAAVMALQRGQLILATDAVLKEGDQLSLDIAGAGAQPFSIRRVATVKEWHSQRKMLESLGARLPAVPKEANRFYAIVTD